LQSQTDKLDDFIQQYQANIYKEFNTRFENQINEFNQVLRGQVREFESKFNITTSITPPKVENVFRIPDFSPSKIERLKPLKIQLWFAKILPGVLIRDVRFWQTPVSISIGPLSVKLGIPIGVENTPEGIRRIQQDVPEQAIQIMNEYLYDTLNRFVDALAVCRRESGPSVNT